MAAPHERPTGERRSSGLSLADLVNDYLAEQAAVILGSRQVLRSGDATSVHATRVAIRRYRTVLRVFAAELAPGADELDADLGWYGRLLGSVRDLQIAGKHLDPLVAALPPELPNESVPELWTAIVEQRAVPAQDTLHRALASRRCGGVLGRLRRYTDAGPCQASRRPSTEVAEFVRSQRRNTRKRLRRARHGAGDALPWHRARKAAKRMRYTAELAAPVLGKPADRQARQARRIQEELGTIQDGEVLLDLLLAAGERAARAGDPAALTFGAMYAGQRSAQHAAVTAAGRLRV